MTMATGRALVAAVLFLTGASLVAAQESGTAKTVDFQRDVRPILANNCFQCHGPDKGNREADLRFDIRESVFADREGRRAVALLEAIYKSARTGRKVTL